MNPSVELYQIAGLFRNPSSLRIVARKAIPVSDQVINYPMHRKSKRWRPYKKNPRLINRLQGLFFALFSRPKTSTDNSKKPNHRQNAVRSDYDSRDSKVSRILGKE